jgi:hypothetical protein
MNLGTATAVIDLDNSKFLRGLSQAETAVNAFGGKTPQQINGVGTAFDTAGKKGSSFFKTVAGTAGGFLAANVFTGLAGGVKNLATSFVSGASDTEESLSKVNQVFGASAGEIASWAKGSASAFGISQQAALANAGTFGNLFTGTGLTQEAASGMSTEMIQLAADLASFNNVPIEQALADLQSGLVGEAEPMRKYGVLLNEASIQAKAMELGLGDANGALTEQEKVLARNALIMEQTGNAQGDFSKTSGGLANQQRILAAQFANLGARLGGAVLPLFTKGIGLATGWMTSFDELRAQGVSPMKAAVQALSATVTKAFGPKAGKIVEGFADAFMDGFDLIKAAAEEVGDIVGEVFDFLVDHADIVGPALRGIAIAFGVLAAGALVATVAMGALSIAMSPITLIVLGIAAVAALLGVAWSKNWGDIQGKTQAVVDWLTGTAWPAIQAGIDTVIAVVAALKAAWDADFGGIRTTAESFLTAL